MEWKDGFTAVGIFVSTLLIIAGWFFARYKDREHEKFKIHLAKTEEIAEAVIDLEITTNELLEADRKAELSKLNQENRLRRHRVCLLVQVYGTEDERNTLNEYQRGMDNGDSLEVQASALSKLKGLLVQSVRSGLGYK